MSWKNPITLKGLYCMCLKALKIIMNKAPMNNKTKTEDPINYMWISNVVDHYLPVSLFVGGFVAGLCVGLIVGST